MNPTRSNDTEETEVQRRSVDVKRLLFDWSSVVAIGLVCITWGVLHSDVQRNRDDIKDLRDSDNARKASDVRVAETMATRADVQRVADKLDELAREIRSAAIRQ